MSISRLITGLFFLVVGIALVVASILTVWWTIFYGLILIGLGIALLINKHEDKIEKRKDLKERRYTN
jgi:hypothetical protein